MGRTRFSSAVVICLCAASVPAYAQDFSWQLGGGVTGSHGFHTTSLDATYFLKPIDGAKGPLSLASFLNPTTRVSMGTSEPENFPSVYSVNGRYVWPSTGWYAGARYSEAEPSSFFERSSDYGAIVGKYLGERTTLELTVGKSEQRSGPFCLLDCAAPPVATFEQDTHLTSLDLFHVRTFGSLTYALHGAISTSDLDSSFRTPEPLPIGTLQFPTSYSSRSYAAGAELFPTARLGIRVGYSSTEIGASDVDSYDLTATWFFKPRVAVQFEVDRSSVDGIDPRDINSIRFIGRF